MKRDEAYKKAADLWTDMIANAARANQAIEAAKEAGDVVERADKEEQYAIRSVSDKELQDLAEQNIKTVATMNPVAVVDEGVVYTDTKTFKKKLLALFAQYDYSVVNDIIGDVEVGKSGIKHDLGHLGGAIKRATYYAIPDVIQKGKIISFTPNYTGHTDKKDRIIIAAPVTVRNNGDYLVGVVLERIVPSDYQKYYMHSVVVIKIDDSPLSEAPNGRYLTDKPSNVTEILRRAVALGFSGNRTVTQDVSDVNSIRSVRRQYEQSTYELVGENDRLQKENAKMSKAIVATTKRSISAVILILLSKQCRRHGGFFVTWSNDAELPAFAGRQQG